MSWKSTAATKTLHWLKLKLKSISGWSQQRSTSLYFPQARGWITNKTKKWYLGCTNWVGEGCVHWDTMLLYTVAGLKKKIHKALTSKTVRLEEKEGSRRRMRSSWFMCPRWETHHIYFKKVHKWEITNKLKCNWCQPGRMSFFNECSFNMLSIQMRYDHCRVWNNDALELFSSVFFVDISKWTYSYICCSIICVISGN